MIYVIITAAQSQVDKKAELRLDCYSSVSRTSDSSTTVAMFETIVVKDTVLMT